MEKVVVFKGSEFTVSDSLEVVCQKVGKTYDIKPLKKVVEDFSDAIGEMEAIAAKHQVRGEESEKVASDMANQARVLSTAIDKARKVAKDPALKFGVLIDGNFKPLTKRLEKIRDDLGYKVVAHRQAVRREQEELARKVEEAERKAREAGKIAIVVAPRPVDTFAKTKTELGSAGTRLVPVFDVNDWTKVDPKYLILNEKALKDDLKIGITNFNGITITHREEAQFRSR